MIYWRKLTKLKVKGLKLISIMTLSTEAMLEKEEIFFSIIRQLNAFAVMPLVMEEVSLGLT